MPLYEYECEGGHRFEELHSMEDRHNAVCPICRKPVKLGMSSSTFRLAEPFSVYAHDGTLLHRRQTIEKTPPFDYVAREHGAPKG